MAIQTASKTVKKNISKKVFVLDTSVLLYDHNSITTFEENDVAIPITVLEELDKFKVGNETKNYEAREVIRFIDRISGNGNLNDWVKLPGTNKGRFKILLHQYQEEDLAEKVYGKGKNDHKIINSALTLQLLPTYSRVVMLKRS